MAASIVIPARTGHGRRAADLAVVANAVARTAPRGPGLAEVVALPVPRDARGPVRSAPLPAAAPDRAPLRPALRVVPTPSRTTPRRGRLVVAAVAVLLVVAGSVTSMRAVLADPAVPAAAGHVVLEPGETLWDVAVRSAPTGVDPREQLDALQRLNGFGSATLDAWTVVLIPAP